MTDLSAIGLPRWLLWNALRGAWLLLWPLFRLRATGVRDLPRDRGYLLLANHVSTFDTAWIAAPLGRPVHFMASAGMFRNPVAGWLLRAVGAFPKEVGVRDEGSMQTVRDLLDARQIVQIMPEGARTWDGRLRPIGQGIGHLAKRLGVPVVCCSIRTGHLWWPRWATWPRWVPVELHYQVLTWPEDADPAAITADIAQALAPPEHPAPDGPTLALRTAEGLPTFLWACPACLRLGPRAAGSELSCPCGARWTVTVDQRLVGQGSTPDRTLRAAWDRLVEGFGDPPRLSDDTILAAEDATVVALPREGGEHVVARGRLVLHDDALRCGAWTQPLAEVRALHMDVGNVLLLRTEHAKLRLEPGAQSTLMWEHFVTPRWEAARCP